MLYMHIVFVNENCEMLCRRFGMLVTDAAQRKRHQSKTDGFD